MICTSVLLPGKFGICFESRTVALNIRAVLVTTPPVRIK
jgi:hypothetical protein